ncbi:hypothetical protein ACFS07_25995 [Undibacterium arcticum]
MLLAAKPLLAPAHHNNLLRVAIPLAASLVLIRLGFHILRRAFGRQGQVGNFLLIFEKAVCRADLGRRRAVYHRPVGRAAAIPGRDPDPGRAP